MTYWHLVGGLCPGKNIAFWKNLALTRQSTYMGDVLHQLFFLWGEAGKQRACNAQ